MKTKLWAINESGDIVPGNPFGLDSFVIRARTKSEAAKSALLAYSNLVQFGRPILLHKDGAFLLLSHNGTAICAESGVLGREGDSGMVHPLCSASHKTMSEAVKDPSFAYYCSKEYRDAAKA